MCVNVLLGGFLVLNFHFSLQNLEENGIFQLEVTYNDHLIQLLEHIRAHQKLIKACY